MATPPVGAIEQLIEQYRTDPKRPIYYYISMYPPNWENFMAFCVRKRLDPNEVLQALGLVVNKSDEAVP